MNVKKLKKQIRTRKKLINTLLLYLRPTNIVMVYLSQDLDKHITRYQKLIFLRHKKANHSFLLDERLIA